MQLLATLLAAATVGIAIAQQTPQCALTCLAELDTESGCQQTDIQCLCSSPAVPDAVPCVLRTCANEVEEVEAFATQICASAGVTVDVAGLVAAATANATHHNATATHGQAHSGSSANSSSSGPTHVGFGSSSGNASSNGTAPLPPTSAGVRDTAAGAFALTALAVAAALAVL